MVLGGLIRVHAEVRLPAIFSDHLVLQTGVTVPVWGWAEPGEAVTVTVAGQTKNTRAAADGRWRVDLAKLTASAAPTTLTVRGRNTLTIRDVLVGEVWLGSGQSNMAMTVVRSNDPEREAAAANRPQIRMFKEESAAADTPQAEGKGRWVVCAPETVGAFSATLYFFGREVHAALGVPVGLINSSVGGTPIESWIAPEVQRAAPELKEFFAPAKAPTPEAAEAAKRKYERDLAKWQADVKQARANKQKAPRSARRIRRHWRHGRATWAACSTARLRRSSRTRSGGRSGTRGRPTASRPRRRSTRRSCACS
jgi:sialate O-acetylesterase